MQYVIDLAPIKIINSMLVLTNSSWILSIVPRYCIQQILLNCDICNDETLVINGNEQKIMELVSSFLNQKFDTCFISWNSKCNSELQSTFHVTNDSISLSSYVWDSYTSLLWDKTVTLIVKPWWTVYKILTFVTS